MATLPGLPQTDEPEPDALAGRARRRHEAAGRARYPRVTSRSSRRGPSASRRARGARGARCTIRGAPNGAGADRRWFESGHSCSSCWPRSASPRGPRTSSRCRASAPSTRSIAPNGAWQGDRCSGQVVAGTRYRYRALKPHGEVIFWTVGTNEPSGKFSECTIQDGRNWVCKVCADAARSITLQMAQGVPVAAAPAVTRPFRAVSKWRWLLLQRGFTADHAVPVAAAAPRREAGERAAEARDALRLRRRRFTQADGAEAEAEQHPRFRLRNRRDQEVLLRAVLEDVDAAPRPGSCRG